MRFVKIYDAVIGALGWFVVINALLSVFGVPLGLMGVSPFSTIERTWFHVSIALSATLFVLSIPDRRLQRSVQVFNDKFERSGRSPSFSDIFVKSVGGSAIAAAISIPLLVEMLLLAMVKDIPQSVHVFAAFFSAILVAMQALKYDPEMRARVVSTFPYDPGETPVPASFQSVLCAGVIIAGLGAVVIWLAPAVWYVPFWGRF